MISKRPYLLRAMHEWMSDNALTPHVVIDATREDVQVPAQYVSDGKIVLNLSLQATQGLSLGNEVLSFSARFGGSPFRVSVPIPAVLGIYARETGQGMIFSAEEEPEPDGSPPDGGDDGAPGSGDEGRRGHLKVVK